MQMKKQIHHPAQINQMENMGGYRTISKRRVML